MEHRIQARSKATWVGVYYLVCLFLLTALTIRCELFAKFAGDIKPYSILFTGYATKELQRGFPIKVIFFGDSSLFYPPDRRADSDAAHTHTPLLLQESLSSRHPYVRIGVAEWAFASANMFHYYCMFYKAMDFSPDLVIIPINWNSLSPVWKALAKDEFMELSALVPALSLLDSENPLRPYGISHKKQLRYEIQIFSLYPMGFKEWAINGTNVAIARASRRVSEAADDGSLDFVPRRDHDHGFLRAAYPMNITEEHEIFRYIRAIIQVGRKHQVRILFYINPINQTLLEELDIMDHRSFERSKDGILKAIQEQGGCWTDLSDVLSEPYFVDEMEHYSLEGRKIIAERLSTKVIAMLEEGGKL